MSSLKLPHWLYLVLALASLVVSQLLAWQNSGAIQLAGWALSALVLAKTPLALFSDSVQTSARQIAAKTAAGVSRMLSLVCLVILACTMSGCMASIAQPGQTPAQLQACSTDATLHNISAYVAGAAAVGATTEASFAAAESSPSTQQGLAIAGIATAAVAGLATLGSQLTLAAYNSDGCGPALTSSRSASSSK